MSRQLKVLLVEDSEDDAALLTRELKKGGVQPIVAACGNSRCNEKSIGKTGMGRRHCRLCPAMF